MTSQNTPAHKAKSSKSSLVSHTYPPFYACYLLKSVKNPKSTATYIGSSPHPPRRIRQHNGELTQGAWKTARNRPWVMSMIVHGFPSKLAALQFEWAWQHPNLSRHLRSGDITKARTLKGNIAVMWSMLTSHPYTNWPLHVKIFTSEAVKCWNEACKGTTPLPPGFTISVELEGVDGKSEVEGGRKGPIDVTDWEFTSSHLAKHAAMLSAGARQTCTMCGSDFDINTVDPLSLALCPTSGCTSYAHLTCLATSFLSHSASSSIIPRGGECIECQKYVLWGDIVRGCYRRRTSRHGVISEQSTIMEEPEEEDNTREFFSDDDDLMPLSPRKRKAPGVTRATPRRRASSVTKATPRKEVPVVPLEEDGEFFELNAIGSSDSSPSAHTSRGAKKLKSPPRPRGRSRGSKNRPKSPNVLEKIRNDIDHSTLTDEDPLTRQNLPSRGRMSESSHPSDVEVVDALASMCIHDADIATDEELTLFPYLRKASRRPHELMAGGKGGTDVIEISD